MHWISTIGISILGLILTACGGGGSAAGVSGSQPGAAQSYASALDFESPANFINGQSFTTTRSTVSVSGALNSVSTPRGDYCPGTPPKNFSVRWTLHNTAASGVVPVYIGCVTISWYGEQNHGIESGFLTGDIPLSVGANHILFETFEGNRKVGEDAILIVREDRTPPTAIFRYPPPGANDTPKNHPVVITFSEAMNPDSLNADRFTLTDAAGNPVFGELRYDRRSFTWILQPDFSLRPGEPYAVVVSGDIEDAAGSNPLGASVSWSFIAADTEDATRPSFDRRWPGPACACAPADTRVLSHFDETIDPATVDEATIIVRDEREQIVPGQTVYRGDYLEFIPEGTFARGETYRVTSAPGITDLVGHTLSGSVDWAFTIDQRLPSGSWVDMADSGQVPAMAHHTAVWAEPEVIFWGHNGGAAYNPAVDSWSLLTTHNAPTGRQAFSATWAAAEMIVWGGRGDGVALNTGGRYDPADRNWRQVVSPLPPEQSATYDHVAVWTGSELIVWGGYATRAGDKTPYLTDRGFRYDPIHETWMALPMVGAPSPRQEPVHAWTGNQLVIWGGKNAEGQALNDGARYDPTSDTWTPMSQQGAPRSHGHSEVGVWNGSAFMVWNGGATAPDQFANNRFREPTLRLYDPATDRWRQSDSGWEPFLISQSWGGRPREITAHWTGEKLFVLAGTATAGAWFYDPRTDGWQAAAAVGGRFGYAGKGEVWAGDRLVQWGGIINVMPTDDGKVFLP